MRLLLCAFFFLYHSMIHAGGHTGNGGGSVHCEGSRPLVLDYYEVMDQGARLLPIESMSRMEFMSIISSRLRLAQERKKHVFIYSEPTGDEGRTYQKIMESLGPIVSWKKINPLKILDEGMKEELPQGCIFRQAAYSNYRGKYSAYQIPEVVESLSPGQKLILELHESMWFIQQSHLLFNNYVITSNTLREFVQVLLLNKVSYSELRLAYFRFLNPMSEVEWEKGDIKLSFVSQDEKLQSYRGVYILNKSESNLACAEWSIIGGAGLGNYMLYQFSNNQIASRFLKKGQNLDISIEGVGRGIIIHDERTHYVCTYSSANDNQTIMRKNYDLFPVIPYPELRLMIHSKNLIQHFSDKAIGLASPFEDDMRNILSLIKD